MKFSAKSSALIFALLFGAAMNVFAQFSINESPLPAPSAPVNDFANVIDDAVERELNQKIIEFKARTNPQVVLAVATIKTTGGRPIEEYSLAVYRGWKIGTANDDNPGALLLVAIDDKKYFTQVGKDLED
nr:TPM domain-containing protein [Pyrinomonadaceae bacterium]